MTKDTEEFSQFTESVTCREYTLPRDEDTSKPKDWIRGNTKIWVVLEVTTCCLRDPPRFTSGNFVFRSRNRYARQMSLCHGDWTWQVDGGGWP